MARSRHKEPKWAIGAAKVRIGVLADALPTEPADWTHRSRESVAGNYKIEAAVAHVKVTDDLPYERAEQMLLTLIDESPRAEEMRRLYHYLRECEAMMGNIWQE